MSKIRAQNTKPEIALRKGMWNMGIRYRIHSKDLPGRPDIFIKKYKLAIFIDGEFWHGFDWDVSKLRLKTRKEFWIDKIETNIKRDQLANENLQKLGYTVFRFWSHDIAKNLGACLYQIQQYIQCIENKGIIS
ncbi:MAG: very short patch repair endonuclease [Pseudopedobacter saltans]|uniref:Very short patch repair endonuclease n=1 Tax=Pseudopedobacter saltans TaxID=151895 RepID=A0A2W5HEE5_9SPHI|nr:MAG: very short patch repair endonuclease [Pseudopedobacter saltans]